MKRRIKVAAVGALMACSSAGSLLAQNAAPNSIPYAPYSPQANDPWANSGQPVAQAPNAPAAYQQPAPAMQQAPQSFAPQAQMQNGQFGPQHAPSAYGQVYSYQPNGLPPQQQQLPPQAPQFVPQEQPAAYAAPAQSFSQQQFATEPAPQQQNSALENELARLRQQVSAQFNQQQMGVQQTAAVNQSGTQWAASESISGQSISGSMQQTGFHSGGCDSVTSSCGPSCSTPSCSTPSCGPTDCCQPCDCSYWYAGAELLWLKPSFQENTGIILDPPPNDNTLIPFDESFNPAYRFWLGYTGDSGLGAQFRYFEFDHELDSLSIVTPAGQLALAEVFAINTSLTRNAFAGPGQLLEVNHSLLLRTMDFEATSTHTWYNSTLMGSFGARYARMEQYFEASAFDTGVLDEYVEHKHGFEGAGPTISGTYFRTLGGSGFSLYANARGSVLFGDVWQDIFEIKNAGANTGTDTYDGEESLTIAELGLGVQYSRNCFSNTLMFFRMGYESQIWFDAGGPLITTGDMNLHGITLALGFQH